MSANGRAAGCPPTASWNAVSTSSSDRASTIVPPCTSGSKPGLHGELRQPVDRDVDLDCARARSSSARCRRRTRPGARRGRRGRRNAIVGWTVVTTTGASSSSPSASATPVTRPSRVRMRVHRRARCGSRRRTTGPRTPSPRSRPPMPPAGNPHAPSSPVADVAELVVGHHERRAGRPRSGPRADHAGHRQHALELG